LRKFFILFVFVVTLSLVLPLGYVIAGPPAHPALQDVEAKIDSPLPNTMVQGRVQVKGSALHPQFDFYKVEFGPGESPADDQMAIIGAIHNEQVTNNVLETWDTTIIPDGTYTLRLRVVDITGNYQESVVTRISVNNTMPTPTATPNVTSTPVPLLPPTATPTIILPSPTIMVEQPFLDQPTATPPPPPTIERPTQAAVVEAEPVDTPTPGPTDTPAPAITDLIQPQEWGNSLCYGALCMFGVFLFFGLLSALRWLILALLNSRS